MIFRRITLNACLALLVVSNSAAAPLRNFKVGGWLAGAYSNDSTGEFSHCAASAAYGSGISVFFAISKDFTWRMSFSKPEWKLSTGAAYDIAFTVDNMPPVVSRAVAVGSNQVVVALNDSSDLFQRFRRGFVLSVAAADQVFRFNLTGTSQLLPVLLRCAMQNGNPQIATNPFQKATRSAAPLSRATASSDRSAERAEATTLVANLLSQAGIRGFQLLGQNDLPSIKADAKWMAGPLFGTVSVIPDIQPSQLSEMPALLIAGDAKSCKGTFLSGAIRDEQKSSFARVFTTCNSGKDTTTVYYLAVPRQAGGAYVMTTATVGSEAPAKEADNNIRTAVYKVLPGTN